MKPSFVKASLFVATAAVLALAASACGDGDKESSTPAAGKTAASTPSAAKTPVGTEPAAAATLPARQACQAAVVWALSDDRELQRSIEEVVSSIFE